MARAAVMAESAVTEREIPEIGVLVLRTPRGQQSIVEKRLRESKRFRSVEPNYLVWLNEMPDDPLYEQQWGLQAVAAPLAWDAVRGDGVTIAVVDTGIDSTHPDLSARVVAGLNTITESLDTADDHGHGTSIAGIAGAAGFNALGIIGVAPETQLMPVKSLNAAGYGTYADVAQGIVYATDHGARVINLSLGGEVDSTTLSSAVEYAVSRGVVVVAAAGNLGSSGPMYPAAYPDVIAVGATDAQDARASFSNFGPWLDLVAPGVDITTTSLGGFYGDLSGTSPAAPFVAGAAALVLAANPTLQPHQVASVLDLASEDRGSPGFDTYYGWGRLNVARAVEQAIALSQTPDAGAPAVRLVAPEDGASVAGVVALSVEASDDVSVVRVEYNAGGIVVASATQPPFTAQWDTQLVAAGAHLLGATAYDAYGNRGLAPSISVEVAGNEMACSTPGGICLPGGGAPAVDCLAEWFVVGDDIDEQTGRKSPVVTCTDGAACDRDGGADGVCTFHAAICFAVADSRLTNLRGAPACNPEALSRFELLAPGPRRWDDPIDAVNGAALVTAVAALGSGQCEGSCLDGARGRACGDDGDCDAAPGTSNGRCALEGASLAGAVGSSEPCTALQVLRVPLGQTRHGYKEGRRKFKIATSADSTGRRRTPKDTDSLQLVCLPPE